MMRTVRFFISTIALILLTATAWAQSGTISGLVTDVESGEPLPSVNVVIDGTTQGATTNLEGQYSILNVSPGTYSLHASFVGYSPQTVDGVRVNIGLTTTVDFELQEGELGLGEMVVTAERPIVQRDVSASMANLSMEDFENLPVASVEGVIGLQAGIRGLSIRGGGEDQLAFMVDGMSFRDGRDNAPFTGISYSSISEIQVQTGGFNAEYGNVRSGLINVVTREGDRNRYSADIITRYAPPTAKHFGIPANHPEAYYMRPYLDPDVAFVGTHSSESPWDSWTQNSYPRFEGWNQIAENNLSDGDPTTNLTPEELQETFLWYRRKDLEIESPDYEFDASIGGPVPGISSMLGDLRFLGSYRQTQTAYIVPQLREGHLDRMGQIKLTSDLSTALKLTLIGMYANELGLSTSAEGGTGMFRGSASQMANSLSMEGIFHDNNWSNMDVERLMLGAELTHVLNPSTFYEVRLQRSATSYDTYFGRNRDYTPLKTFPSGFELTEAPFGWDRTVAMHDFTGMILHSNARAQDTSRVTVWSGRYDITSQLNQYSQLKAGAEIIHSDFDVRHGELDLLWRHHLQPKYTWNRQPLQGAAYVQNKFEFRQMVANLGLRLDYFTAGGRWYNYSEFDRAFSPTVGIDHLDEVLEQEPVEQQVNLSPRLGVSFPITENSKLYFNYGHFRQMLDPNNMFRVRYINTSAIDQIGNPNHPLPRTVAYELGYDQNVLDIFLLRLAGFYRDAADQPANVRHMSIDGLVNYVVTQPYNYNDTRGLEITLTKASGGWIRGFVNYTYMVEKGGNFGFNQVFENRVQMRNFLRDNREHYQSKPIPRPYARMNLEFITPSGFGPNILGENILEDWRLSFLGEWRSGDVLTWTGGGPSILGLENNVRYRGEYFLDMRLSKNFSTAVGDAQFFVDGTNILNLRQLNQGSAFVGTNDFRDYMNSLHLSKDAFEDIGGQAPYQYIPGDDRPGDYRKRGVEFVPIEIVSGDLPATGHPRPLYYVFDTQEYWQWSEDGWVNAPSDRVDQVLKEKAYINMPNNVPFTFLNPRRITFGFRIRL